jgi:hypothetical protein
MPRIKRPESVRINLEVNPSVRDRLDRLREATEAESITEVIRRALAVYETLVDLSDGKGQIMLRPKGGDETPLILVP